MIAVELVRKERVADAVWLFELASVDGETLPTYAAGAHIDVEIAPGLVRQYSLCNPPGLIDRFRIAVLREPGSRGGSAAMVDDTLLGARIRISPPRNVFALNPEARGSRLFAGGIGITPILAMANQLWARGEPFRLWYAGRNRSSMAFHAEIAQSPFAAQTVLHADDEAGAFLDLSEALFEPRPGENLYVCGPAGFIEAVLNKARANGWPLEALHREHFTASKVEASAALDDQAFTLRLRRSGRDIVVAADQTALEALLAHGVDLEWSCEQGVCGSCVTRVLDGCPDHRDLFMTDAEHAANDQFTPCCSRALTSVLDIDL